METLAINTVYCGDSVSLMERIAPDSIALSFWSPPYFLGKDYEKDATYDSWQNLLKNIITLHYNILKQGGFLVVNIADIISFQDENMPRIMGMNPANRKCDVTKDMILKVQSDFPNYNRQQIASVLNCSEQTIDRRLNGNNIRGGKYAAGTHIKLVGGNIEQYAYDAGLFLYDKRIWKKDPAWANCKWTTNTLKSVSETEDLYIFWKPGEYTVNRERLTANEWKEWGYRQIWEIPSVRINKEHPAMFPKELAYRVIRLYTDEGDIVLDPFLGSGTTAVASIATNRNFIGIEMMKEYADIATKNVRNAQQSQRLFSANTQKSVIIQRELEYNSEKLEPEETAFFDIPEIPQQKNASYAAAINYSVYKDELKI